MEYTQAFLRQTLQTVAAVDLADGELRLKGMTVLLFLAMYQGQSMQTLKSKDLKLLTRIDDVSTLLETLAAKFDASSLAKVIIMTVLQDSSIELDNVSALVQSLIKD